MIRLPLLCVSFVLPQNKLAKAGKFLTYTKEVPGSKPNCHGRRGSLRGAYLVKRN